jgi:hypothetical protein
MSDANNGLRHSALMMRIAGWAIVLFPVLVFVYPPGILWGSLPAGFPLCGPDHPPSPYDGLHPYVFMIVALYLAWGILMIRGATDPRANAALFDYGFLANLFHAVLMAPMALLYPNEHAHLWTDVPALLILAAACWYWHPNRAVPRTLSAT